MSQRLLALALVILYFSGSLVGWIGDWSPNGQPGFHLVTSILLSIGLYLATTGVSRSWFRVDLRRVITAVLLGVAVKAAFVSLVSSLVVDLTVALSLGLVFSQVDPLATSSTLEARPISDRGRTLLQAWASFDDPTTTVLAVALIYFLRPSAVIYTPIERLVRQEVAWVWMSLVVVFALTLLLWLFQGRQIRDYQILLLLPVSLALVALLEAYFVAAVLGILLRPSVVERNAERLVLAISAVSVLAVGTVAGGSERWLLGLALGLLAVLVHAIVSVPISRGYESYDRWSIAVGHQSGLTALVLTLAFEDRGIEVAAIAAPGILATLLLHQGIDAAFERSALVTRFQGLDKRHQKHLKKSKPGKSRTKFKSGTFQPAAFLDSKWLPPGNRYQ